MKKSVIKIALLAAATSLALSGHVAADHMSPMGEDWVDTPNDNHDLRMEEFLLDGDFMGDAERTAAGEVLMDGTANTDSDLRGGNNAASVGRGTVTQNANWAGSRNGAN